eukprot:45279-Hanusia_phi.AAC.1
MKHKNRKRREAHHQFMLEHESKLLEKQEKKRERLREKRGTLGGETAGVNGEVKALDAVKFKGSFGVNFDNGKNQNSQDDDDEDLDMMEEDNTPEDAKRADLERRRKTVTEISKRQHFIRKKLKAINKNEKRERKAKKIRKLAKSKKENKEDWQKPTLLYVLEAQSPQARQPLAWRLPTSAAAPETQQPRLVICVRGQTRRTLSHRTVRSRDHWNFTGRIILAITTYQCTFKYQSAAGLTSGPTAAMNVPGGYGDKLKT